MCGGKPQCRGGRKLLVGFEITPRTVGEGGEEGPAADCAVKMKERNGQDDIGATEPKYFATHLLAKCDRTITKSGYSRITIPLEAELLAASSSLSERSLI